MSWLVPWRVRWRGASVALFLVLLAVLTWLWWEASNQDTAGYTRMLAAVDRYADGQVWLTRDVLRARTGLLREYDTLVYDANEMHAAVMELQALDAPGVALLRQGLQVQEDRTETFKSQNALLQNSLASFDMLTRQPEIQQDSSALGDAVAGLVRNMLHLALNASDGAVTAAGASIADVEQYSRTRSDLPSLRQLLAHGRMLLQLLPAVDAIVKELLSSSSAQQEAAVRTAILQHHAQTERHADLYRIGQYAVSLCLAGLLVHFALVLRHSTMALRRRAALEHVIAELSTRLINCPMNEVRQHIEQGLHQLASCIGMDRAYIMQTAGEANFDWFAWHRPGQPIPAEWPHLLVAGLRSGQHFTYAPQLDRMPDGLLRQALAQVGVSGWICLRIPVGKVEGVLAFDRTRRGGLWPEPELALLYLAADAFVGVLRRHALESHRAVLERRIHQTKRMEAIGGLASGIAHNFNNIVGAILGYAEMAEAQLAPQSRVLQHVAEIARAAERARDLIGRILDFGQPRAVRRRQFEVHELFEETASLFRASLPRDASLSTDAFPQPVLLQGDVAQLQQVLINLCRNALQAMNGQGEVRMGMEVVQTGALELAQGTLPAGGYLRISVSDRGDGMAPPVVRRIFEPFFTTRAAGTGLGLATALEVVQEHEGAIHVESTPGTGSCFQVWLPTIMSGPQAHPAPAAETSEVVMLLDGDTGRRLETEEILAALGYEPVGFGQPGAVMEACRHGVDRFDALLVCLPDDDDRAAAELRAALSRMNARLPMLIALEAPGKLRFEMLHATEACEVIGLPVNGPELSAALSRCLLRRPAES